MGADFNASRELAPGICGVSRGRAVGNRRTQYASTWTAEEIAVFDKHYVSRGGAWVAKELGCSRSRVYQRAHRASLKKARRQRGKCDCGDHAWVALTGGHCTLLDPHDLDALGSRSWAITSGYAATSGRCHSYMHRKIMSPPRHLVVDHLNGDRLDNRRRNLRICTQSENLQNIRKPTRAKSGFRGVRRCHGRGWRRWTARIKNNGVDYYLGTFATAEDAARAYDAAALRLRGDHILLNLPLEVAA